MKDKNAPKLALEDAKEEKKAKKPRNWGKFLQIAVVVILVLNSLQIWSIGSVASRVDQYNRGAVDEMGKLMSNVAEIRRFVGLPDKTEDAPKENDSTTTSGNEQESSTNSQAVFAMLDQIVKEEKTTKNLQLGKPVLDALIKNTQFSDSIKAGGLNFGDKSDTQVKFVDSEKAALYNLVFDSENNKFKVQSALGDQDFAEYTAPDFAAKVAEYMTQNIQAVREKKQADQKAQAEAENKVKVDAANQLAQQKKELDDLMKDKAFTETLASIGLQPIATPKTENNKYFYDVVDANGKTKFALAVELSTGMMKVIRNDQETYVKSFLDALQDDGSKKKP